MDTGVVKIGEMLRQDLGLHGPAELQFDLVDLVVSLVLDQKFAVGRHHDPFACDLDTEGLTFLEGVGDAAQGLDKAVFGNILLNISFTHLADFVTSSKGPSPSQKGRMP